MDIDDNVYITPTTKIKQKRNNNLYRMNPILLYFFVVVISCKYLYFARHKEGKMSVY